MKECNFAGQMEKVSRFIFFISLLIFCGKAHSDPKVFPGEDFSIFEENGKVGLKNQQGQVLIPAQYEAMGWSNGKFSLVGNVTGYRVDGRWGLINISNNRITKPQYLDLSPGEGELIVGRKGIPGSVRVVAGCINTSGKEIIPFEYDGLRVSSFRAIVYVKSGSRFRHGLIDYDNKVLIPLAYQNIFPLGSLRYGVENFENKIAIFSEDGRQITGFDIDRLSEFRKNFAIVYQDGLQGLIDREGRIKIEPAYREFKIEDDGTISARLPDEWIALTGANEQLRTARADSVSCITSGLVKICINGKTRLAEPDLKPVGILEYTSIGPFTNQHAVAMVNSLAGVINDRGEVVIKPVYNDLIIDRNAIRANKTIHGRNRWLLLNSAGEVMSKNNYEYIGPFNGKFFPALNRGFWGAIDARGDEIIACVHDSLMMELNDRVVVKFKGQYGIIGLDESWIVTPQPNKLEIINDTLYLSRSEKTTFLRSMKGELIYFSDHSLLLNGDHFLEKIPSGEFWQIDFTGVIRDRGALPDGVEWISPTMSEGLRLIKKDGRFGFIDQQGRLRIANRYEQAMPFSEGLSAVMIRGRWGFIDRHDQLVIQPVYDDVAPFSKGFSRVKQKDDNGVIDKTGNVVVPLRYDEVIALDKRRFKFRQGNHWGLTDAAGQMFIHAKYDIVKALDNGFAIVGRDGKFGLINRDGVSTIPMQYDGLTYDPFHDEYLALKRAEWVVIPNS